MVVGVMLGILVGVLPGLGAPNGVSLLLPLTFSMDPVSAIILLTSMYWGALFGGSTTSILFNIPGEPSSVATTFDGYPMAKQRARGAGADARVHLGRRSARWSAWSSSRCCRRGSRVSRSASARPNISPSISWPSPASSGLAARRRFKTIVSMGLGLRARGRGHGHHLGQPAPDLRLRRTRQRHQLPRRGDRPVRHRRIAA